jgi:hypothetical protein
MVGLVPHRHPVAPGPQGPVEGAGGVDHVRARGRLRDLVDQGVDGRTGDAREVVGARRACGAGTVGLAQLGAGGETGAEAAGGDVEVEILDPGLVLRRVDEADAGADADEPEVADEGLRHRLEHRVVVEELDLQELAGGQPHHPALAGAAGLAQERHGAAQQGAVLARTVGFRRAPGVAEHLRRKVPAHRVEEREFFRGGPAGGLEVRVLEVGGRAYIGAVHQVGVRPVEVEAQADGLADAGIAKRLPTGVQPPALRARGAGIRHHFLADPAFLGSGKVVARRPDPRRKLLAEGEGAALEGLERHLPVAKVLVADGVEIVLADIHRQVRAPVILDPFQLDEAAGFQATDLIGAGPQGRLERRGLEVTGGVIGRREHRQGRDEQRQVAAAAGGEAKHHRVVAFGHDLGQVADHLRDLWVALLLQEQERRRDIAGGEARAVVETRLGPQDEAVGQAILRDLHRAGEQPVERVGLIERPHHQGVEGQVHAGGAVAAQDVDVQGVEGVGGLVAHRGGELRREAPAARGIRVDVVEVREVGGVFQVAEARQAVAGAARGPGLGWQDEGGGQSAAARHHRTPGRARAQRGAPVLAASASSYHQVTGKPELPYFGSVAGWPKRFQRRVRETFEPHCGTT